MNDIETQFQTLINEAKALKSTMDMAKLDYKHIMKKLTILAEQYPALAAKHGLTKVEEKV